MKRLFLPILIAFLGMLQMNVEAQPTLTAANTNVQVGEQFISNHFSGSAATFNTGLTTGANQTWNFSNLTSPFFPAINVLFQPYLPIGGYNAFPTSNAVIGCDDEYEFLKTNNDSVMLVGFINHFTEELREYSNPIKKLQYPFTFNNAFTDSCAGQYRSMSPWINFSGNISVEADGYGTLILPGGTVTNVLRVKSILITSSFHPNFISEDSITTLDWYLPGVHVPILKIIKQKYSAPNYNATYYQGYYINPFALGVKEETSANLNLQTFPNPATSQLTIQYTLKSTSRVSLIISDGLGKEAMKLNEEKQPAGNKTQTLDISKLPKGIYNLQLKTDEDVTTKRFVVQ